MLSLNDTPPNNAKERPLHVTIKMFNAQKLRLQSLELRQWFCIAKRSELQWLQTDLLLSLTSGQTYCCH